MALRKDDEFFGDQDDESSDNENSDKNHNDGFGAMRDKEVLAREKEYEAIGFLAAYEDAQDSRLQEGFEVGYREIYDVAARVGSLLGDAVAKNELDTTRSSREISSSNPKNDDKYVDSASRNIRQAVQTLHEFLERFESRPDGKDRETVKPELETVENEMNKILSGN